MIDEPAGGTTRTEVVSSRSSTPMLLLGIGVVAAIVLALALSRSGDDAAVEPIDEGAAESTTLPTTAAQAPPPTTAPPTTLGTGATIDVSDVPSELTDQTLLLFERDRVATFDLRTGEVSPFRLLGAGFNSNEHLSGTNVGVFALNDQSGQVHFVPWSLDEKIVIDGFFFGDAIPVADEAWFFGFDPLGGDVRLSAIDLDGEVRVVRETDSWLTLVGATGDALLASSPLSGTTHRIEPDGSISAAFDGLAMTGGTDWLLVPRCDDALRCSSELVDLRTGTTTSLGDVDLTRAQPIGRSQDGRRLLVFNSLGASPQVYLVDADDATIDPVTELFTMFDPFRVTTDAGLTHHLELNNQTLTFRDLATGEATVITLSEPVQHVLVAPEGWGVPS